MDVAIGALGCRSVRILTAARIAPAAVTHAEHGVAALCPIGRPVVRDLRAAPAVEVADGRIGTVGALRRRRRQEHVDVDLGPVERVRGAAAEAGSRRLCRAGHIAVEDARGRGLGTRRERQGAEDQPEQQRCLVPLHVSRTPKGARRPYPTGAERAPVALEYLPLTSSRQRTTVLKPRAVANRAAGREAQHMSMFDVTRVSVEVGGEEISFETGKLARQASGAVVVRSGDTMVLCTATAGNERDVDFLPLTVDVEEKHYAAGKIPGSFFRREARAGEKATLTARMIDRPLRPLFPKGWHRETQLVAIPMSIDHEHPYDILAMNAASAALAVSDIPFPVPVGAVRIGLSEDGDILVNPHEETLMDSSLDLVVAGTEEAILMVEAGANEVSEAEILDALDIAHGEIKKWCQAQNELREKAGKEKLVIEPPKVDEGVLSEVKDRFGDALTAATQVEDKLERQDATKRVEEETLEGLASDAEDKERRAAVQLAFDKLEKDTIRQRIAVDKKRP